MRHQPFKGLILAGRDQTQNRDDVISCDLVRSTLVRNEQRLAYRSCTIPADQYRQCRNLPAPGVLADPAVPASVRGPFDAARYPSLLSSRKGVNGDWFVISRFRENGICCLAPGRVRKNQFHFGRCPLTWVRILSLPGRTG